MRSEPGVSQPNHGPARNRAIFAAVGPRLRRRRAAGREAHAAPLPWRGTLCGPAPHPKSKTRAPRHDQVAGSMPSISRRIFVPISSYSRSGSGEPTAPTRWSKSKGGNGNDGSGASLETMLVTQFLLMITTPPEYPQMDSRVTAKFTRHPPDGKPRSGSARGAASRTCPSISPHITKFWCFTCSQNSFFHTYNGSACGSRPNTSSITGSDS
jgi:hypothetical protein